LIPRDRARPKALDDLHHLVKRLPIPLMVGGALGG
jgi:hypothetical protein